MSRVKGQSLSVARGFTLIELMITISIIGILASLGLGALFHAQEHARAINTQTTIYKLHAALMERWDGYRYRRVPISIGPTERIFDATTGSGFAWRQLNVRRDIMRMELPERWADVLNPPLVILRTPLSLAYRQYHNSRATSVNRQFEDSECLYMILSMGEDSSVVSEQISHAEAGDKDQDGLPEFWDAWQNPIRFLRWAPGFAPNNPYPDSSVTPYLAQFVAVDSALQSGLSVDDHDQFDSRNVHDRNRAPTSLTTSAYALYPLIYSPGPDGVEDILHQPDDVGNVPWAYGIVGGRWLDPYQPVSVLDPVTNQNVLTLIGQPYDRDGNGLQHLDNIHNHLKGQR